MRFWEHWTRARVVAACAVASTVAWIVHSRAVAPLRGSETEAARNVAELKGHIENALSTIAEIRKEEEDAGKSRNEFEQMQGDLPTGSPLVWLPPLVSETFTSSGLPSPLVHLKSNREDPEIPSCERRSWLVRLPIDNVSRNIAPLLLAVADLDHLNPFVRVLDFAIRPDSGSPSKRSAVLHVAILSPKAKTAH